MQTWMMMRIFILDYKIEKRGRKFKWLKTSNTGTCRGWRWSGWNFIRDTIISVSGNTESLLSITRPFLPLHLKMIWSSSSSVASRFEDIPLWFLITIFSLMIFWKEINYKACTFCLILCGNNWMTRESIQSCYWLPNPMIPCYFSSPRFAWQSILFSHLMINWMHNWRQNSCNDVTTDAASWRKKNKYQRSSSLDC